MEFSYNYVLELTIQKYKLASKQVLTIQNQNHSPTKQLWTIQNLNMFGIRAPTVQVLADLNKNAKNWTGFLKLILTGLVICSCCRTWRWTSTTTWLTSSTRSCPVFAILSKEQTHPESRSVSDSIQNSTGEKS